MLKQPPKAHAHLKTIIAKAQIKKRQTGWVWIRDTQIYSYSIVWKAGMERNTAYPSPKSTY